MLTLDDRTWLIKLLREQEGQAMVYSAIAARSKRAGLAQYLSEQARQCERIRRILVTIPTTDSEKGKR